MLTKYNNGCYVPAFRDDFFNDFFSNRYYGSELASKPAVNIVEENKEFRIDLAAAGLAKDDVKISIDNDILTISSEKKEGHSEKKSRYSRREFNYATFSRSFQLPETVEQESISAEHNNGILTVHLPKKEVSLSSGPKTIEIQ